jgi:Holliday junction DNA helicase RuvA
MISFIRGEVWKSGPDFVVVDTGDQGIKVLCPPATALNLRVGDPVFLFTALIVREDSWTLYGFAEEDQCAMFDLVQTVTGIGPRIALGVVASLSPTDFADAIISEDLAALISISGIGKKGAARMVLELKDKVVATGEKGTLGSRTKRAQTWRLAVGTGLASLGWTAREAEAAMDSVAENYPELLAQAEPDVGELLKASLRSLDRS